jgi:hypothetical protein
MNQDSNDSLPTLDEKTLRQLAQGLSVGIAVVKPENWTVLFENAKFFT